ncbi:hypothetical protein BKM63_05425 [Flavobacterium johnsoniae]|uniref:Uncharacterized protein n=1 Tax=Flavobacterium johnsoniae TaxID=986 RepID=A0A1J7BUD1_FLAJO|nr:hypothetical protein BKM63_05425 [Flavobacterium johnsoniae]
MVLILKLGALKYKIFLVSFLNKIKILKKFLIYLYSTNNSRNSLVFKNTENLSAKSKISLS